MRKQEHEEITNVVIDILNSANGGKAVEVVKEIRNVNISTVKTKNVYKRNSSNVKVVNIFGQTETV